MEDGSETERNKKGEEIWRIDLQQVKGMAGEKMSGGCFMMKGSHRGEQRGWTGESTRDTFSLAFLSLE